MVKRRSFSLTNFAIYGSLWVFAAGCAALPVYVHLHPDQFGPPQMTFYGASESEIRQIETEQARSVAAIIRPRLQLDQITTGSIAPPIQTTRPRVIQAQRQPFPNDPGQRNEPIQFISATSNRALAVVDGRLVIVIPGDRLPDGRLIAGFERANGTISPITERAAVAGEPTPFPRR